MNNTFLIWIGATGVLQALFLSLALLNVSVRNRRAAKYLALLVLLPVFLIVEQLADLAGQRRVFAIAHIAELAMAPTIYWFLRTLFHQSKPKTQIVLAHYLLAFIGFLALLLFYVNYPTVQFSVSNPDMRAVIICIAVLKLSLFIIYGGLAVRDLTPLWQTGIRGVRNQLQWVFAGLLIFSLCICIAYAAFFAQVLGFPILSDADNYGLALSVVFIYLIAYYLLVNRSVLNTSYVSQSLSDTELADVYQKTTDHLRASQRFLNPDYGHEHLVNDLQISNETVSAAVWKHEKISVGEYLNKLRVEEFERLACDPENNSKTTLELAYRSGFNSKATFYRVFRRLKRMTPTEYRKGI